MFMLRYVIISFYWYILWVVLEVLFLIISKKGTQHSLREKDTFYEV